MDYSIARGILQAIPFNVHLGIEIVDIGDGAQAVRYADLTIGDGAKATVFAVPTSAGVATLACTAEAATCDEIAASMKITDGEVFPAGPSG